MYTVYLVDDEPYVIEELKILIDWESYGFRLCGSQTDPLAAEQEILRLCPDLILLDINMKKLDGLRLAEKIKAVLPDICLVFLSAYDNFDYAISAINLGAKIYLMKPVQVRELVNFLIRIKAEFDTSGRSATEEKDGTDKHAVIIQEILADVQQNYGKRLYLSDYAQKYHYTVEYLSRIFKEQTGDSFINHVVHLKMQKAAELIDRSPLESLQTVAYHVGYTDYYQFSKIFKKHMGTTPKDYKKAKQ